MAKRLNYYDKRFREQLSKLFEERGTEIDLSRKAAAKKSGIGWGSFWTKYTLHQESATFSTMFKFCKAYKLDLDVVMGSKEYKRAYSVSYTGDMPSFVKELRATLATARDDANLTQRELADLSGAGQSWINENENQRGDIPKPESIHDVFAAMSAKLTISIAIPKEDKKQ